MFGISMISGMAGRIRAEVAGWDLARKASEREQRELMLARQLDANEVGRRADARRTERESQDRQGVELEK